MHLIKNKVITLIVLVALSVPLFAQFKINEYSCANVSGGTPYTDSYGNTPDWFEIYNTSINQADLSGYYVSDDPSYIGKWQFPTNTLVPGKGFIIVYASGMDTVIYTPTVEYHTNFDLLQTKPEKIILSTVQGVVKDSITIKRHQHNHSWARVPDGNGSWRIFPKDAAGNPTSTPGATNGAIVSGQPTPGYSGYLPGPQFSPEGGFFSGPITLNLGTTGSVTTSNIVYTGSENSPTPIVAGANPATNMGTGGQSVIYAGETISIDSTTVIRAFVDTAGVAPHTWLPSFVETNTYFIDNSKYLAGYPGEFISTQFSLPVVSFSYDPSNSGSYPGFGAGSPPFFMLSAEYFDKNKNLKFKSVGYGTPPSNDNNFFPGGYAGFNFSAEDEYGYNYTNTYQFYADATLSSSGRTTQTTFQIKMAGDDHFPLTWANSSGTEPSMHFRDALAETYAMKSNLNMDGSHYEPCIIFINGEYAGVAEIRENFDTEYTKYYYNTENIQSLEKDGALTASPTVQAASDWNYMVNFILSNNMVNDSLRAIADSMLNFGSLIDLICYNTYILNAGFPTKAAWWRAPDTTSNLIKWRYRMFDMDDDYGLGVNSASIGNTGYDGTVCAYEQAGYGATTDTTMIHYALFDHLMLSDTFKSAFINRYSYLLNTSLQCAPIIAHLKYIKNLLSSDMTQHGKLFAGSPSISIDSIWLQNVDTTIYWINQRCPTINEDIKTCYNVSGPYSFCTDVSPQNSGSVTLNNINYPDAPHSASYFGNVYFDAIGVPDSNYIFDHWELNGFTLPDSLLSNDTLHWLFDSTSCITAVFKLKEPYELTGEPLVPTGFSPNGDGNNDILNVYGTLHATEFTFSIYNRWGQLLFQSNDKTVGWDGKFNGQDVPVGVYAYVYKVMINGEQIQRSGSITLIR